MHCLFIVPANFSGSVLKLSGICERCGASNDRFSVFILQRISGPFELAVAGRDSNKVS